MKNLEKFLTQKGKETDLKNVRKEIPEGMPGAGKKPKKLMRNFGGRC